MSGPHHHAYADPKDADLCGSDGNVIFASGTAVPTDARIGFSPGCIYSKRTGAAAAQLYVNIGTAASCNFDPLIGVDLAGLLATAAELNRLDDDTAVLATLAGTGITGGVGTVIKTSVLKIGALYNTQIYIDLTGLQAIATDLDIIGDAANPAHLGQVTVARNGTFEAIRMTCLELPAGASTDIDLYSASVATGKKDDGIAGISGTALVTAAGAWANGTTKGATSMPTANDYLYLTNGAAANAGTYTAGKFMIELWGY